MAKLPALKPGDVVIRQFPSGRKQLERVKAVADKIIYIRNGFYLHRFDSSTGKGITNRTQRIYVDAGEIVSMQISRAAKGK